ncbi:hypothetical protein JAAARDRAFT_196762 [Jaapia argillacea MUCL 33604]|uniref:NAD(P)-binding protein n=1 Tax=Jaapia argillacea MUCL 33604 TaxID=933084 RepID=A0A067PKT4_9AGAM|nr:hypothetical protein JAAARDRAFT_196762 [Jaapia argillacea MUCL 33604]
MAETYTWLITGASRGIGLEYTKQLISSPSVKNIVIASCRNPETATELQALRASFKEEQQQRLHIVALDVEFEESILGIGKVVAEIVGDLGLDYLINNGAINLAMDTAFDFSPADMTRTMQVNVLGPALLSQTVFPLLAKSKRKVILNTSTGLASMGLDCGPKCLTYSISKTAVNMLTYKQAKERPDFICVAVDPGWVKTVMGGPGAFLEPPEVVTLILSFVQGATTEESGKFFDRFGKVRPW